MTLSREQLLLRKQGLTASDMVVLAHVVPFKKARTVYDLYIDKTTEQPVQSEATDAIELGHEAEP